MPCGSGAMMDTAALSRIVRCQALAASNASFVRRSSCSARRWAARIALEVCKAALRSSLSCSAALFSAASPSFNLSDGSGIMSRSVNSEHGGRQRRAEDARSDFLKRRVPARRSVVAERGESAIVSRAQLGDRDVFGGLQDAVADFLGRLDSRVERIDDTDEDALLRFEVIAG